MAATKPWERSWKTDNFFRGSEKKNSSVYNIYSTDGKKFIIYGYLIEIIIIIIFFNDLNT